VARPPAISRQIGAPHSEQLPCSRQRASPAAYSGCSGSSLIGLVTTTSRAGRRPGSRGSLEPSALPWRDDPHSGWLDARVEPDQVDHQGVGPDRIIPGRRGRRLVQPADRRKLFLAQSVWPSHGLRLATRRMLAASGVVVALNPVDSWPRAPPAAPARASRSDSNSRRRARDRSRPWRRATGQSDPKRAG
jgi:hypothetical protein